MRLLLSLLCLLLFSVSNSVLAQDSSTYPRPSYLYNWSSTISEDQIFVVKYNIPIDESSLVNNTHCNVQGLGEQVGTRIVNGKDRNEILQNLSFAESDYDDESVHLLQCKRLLPVNAQVELVFGSGVKALGAENQSALSSKTAYKYDFKVRDRFKADFSCTRSNANAPCSPLYPIRLNFSSPIAKKYLAEIVLKTDENQYQADQLKTDYSNDGLVDSISFSGPFPEKTAFELTLPDDLQDDMGRSLSNAASFPLSFGMAELPPLVKFATGDFGIIERFANGAPEQNPDISVPVSVRRVGPDLLTQELKLSAGKISDHVLTDSVQAIDWLAKVRRLQSGELTPGQFADVLAARPMRDRQKDEPLIDVRSRSIFAEGEDLNTLDMPGLDDLSGPEIELIGIPITDPGLHIIEIASPELGNSLLADKSGNEKMYVRTAVLLSNLAVHIKTGRDDILAWVTSLDDGKPVPDAKIQVLSCTGNLLLSGITDANGIWHSQEYQDAYDYCDETGMSGLFVTASIDANHPMAYGKDEFSFAWSNWDKGIEPWRFDIPFSSDPEPDLVVHAVMDRTLLHTGETVSIKIFLREQNKHGLSNPDAAVLPKHILINHAGSGEEFKIPVNWEKNASGGLFALADYQIADSAKLGEYTVNVPLPTDDDYWQPSLYAGSFRVESFKLPLLTGSLKIDSVNGSESTANILVAPSKIQADMQLEWISGGVAADIETSLSAVARPIEPYFSNYAEYNFSLPQSLQDQTTQNQNLRRLIVDKQAATMGADGAALIDVVDLPEIHNPQNWLFEMSYKDPNGQVQTIAQTKTVWPADVIVGLNTGRWFNKDTQADVKIIVLDTDAKPVANTEVQLDGRQSTSYSTRKRLVGGFYAYDTHQQISSLGTLCQGKTDNNGILSCPVKLDKNGEVQLIAKTKDKHGRQSVSGTSIWVWGDGSWFGSENNDRIDVIPDKSSYKPGETAQLTVRMPFAHAQALVAIEREGVLETKVHAISGSDPVIKIPIKADWSPNVYVSVLAVRGRLREVSWTSFFDWGWRNPKAWIAARDKQVSDVAAPTATVDLAKPAYRFGIAELKISDEADRLQVKVSTDKSIYQVRELINTDIQVLLPNGKPAANASVAFAAVDEALLELFDNNSWDLLSAMRQNRSYGVATATAQGEVLGRRHYGRKAVPAGGGGGQSATRELFDTLLLWRGNVVLDGAGRASIEVLINDAITKFRLVAVADYGENYFGTGMTDIISTQDLQLISGLSQIIREYDKYYAELTIRNRSDVAMDISLNGKYEYPAGTYNDLSKQTVQLAAGKSTTISWPITAPELAQDSNAETINWWFDAVSKTDQDAIKISQTLLPKIPVQAFQADLLQLKSAKNYDLLLSVPDNAVRDNKGNIRGGADILLQAKLAGTLPGVYDWFKSYPYTCIEQQSAKYIGMQDQEKWQQLMSDLPKYITDNGLLSYFPETSGSAVLTAQIIEITALAEDLGWRFNLPRRARETMIAALQDFANGRLQDLSWPNLQDDFWTKLIVINALVKAGGWQNGMLDSLYFEIVDWPSSALITWLSVLQEIPEFSGKSDLLKLANDTIKKRISQHGTTMILDDESINAGWWLMSNQTTAQARFLLAALKSDYWQNDLPLIFNGLLALQQNGHWQTTSANVLGVLAVNAFSQQQQINVGHGAVTISSNESKDIGTFDWQTILKDGDQNIDLPWPENGQLDIHFAQDKQGSGWATVISKAAIDSSTLKSSGIEIQRQIIPVSQSDPGHWSVGDIYKISLKFNADTDIFWAVVSDPIPAGASILDSGLGRDSSINSQTKNSNYWDYPSYVERDADVFRAYYEYLSKGEHSIEYTVRINNVGDFSLPPTRVQALYQPDVFGALANQAINVQENR